MKRYELANHLGNVLAVVSDRRTGVDSTNDGEVDYYTPQVVSAQDYYPFGMLMPTRQYTAGNGYRYGFNGKETDNEIKGDGNSVDFGNRIYDPKIGRWLSTDPLQRKYPFESPFSYTLNDPLAYTDVDGKDIILMISYPQKDWGAFLNKTFEGKVNIGLEATENGHRITLSMKPGETFKSPETKRAFDYLQTLVNNHDLRVEIWVSESAYGKKTTVTDDYQNGELFTEVLKKHPDGFGSNSLGSLFIHYIAEQNYVQNTLKLLRTTQRQSFGTDYYESHEAAIKEGVNIYGFQWALKYVEQYNESRKLLVRDIDILDANGNYKETIREIHDFSGKSPKYSQQVTLRDDIKAGDKYTEPTNGDSGKIAEYFAKHPLKNYSSNEKTKGKKGN